MNNNNAKFRCMHIMIPNDVNTMIYKEIHRDLVLRLNQEYHSKVRFIHEVVWWRCKPYPPFYFNFRYLQGLSYRISIHNIKKPNMTNCYFVSVAQLPKRYSYSLG